MADPFYRSREWRSLVASVWLRARGKREVPGCYKRGKVVDHIVARKDGGPDSMANCRLLCAAHDNQVKEDATGKRRSGGRLFVRGCRPDGTPLDPGAWWNK